MHAAFYQSRGLHNPYSEDPMSLKHTIRQMRPHLLKSPLAQKSEQEETPRWSILTSGRRFARSLQIPTRLLNTATGFSKRLLRSRVGDSEMGAETESLPVNSGHALALK